MSITDELRSFTTDPLLGIASQEQHIERLLHIADRIDAEHERLLAVAWDDGRKDGLMDGCSHYDVEHTECMVSEEHGWVKLPLDADGVPIRIGDVVRWGEDGEPFEVKTIIYHAGCETEVGDGERYGELVSIFCHHYHTPTVEDVLREFGDWYAHTKGGCDEQGIISEYAAKLALREDA